MRHINLLRRCNESLYRLATGFYSVYHRIPMMRTFRYPVYYASRHINLKMYDS